MRFWCLNPSDAYSIYPYSTVLVCRLARLEEEEEEAVEARVSPDKEEEASKAKHTFLRAASFGWGCCRGGGDETGADAIEEPDFLVQLLLLMPSANLKIFECSTIPISTSIVYYYSITHPRFGKRDDGVKLYL